MMSLENKLITLRLGAKLEQSVNNIAHQMGISRSELITKSIVEFIAKQDKPSAWELGCDVFGKYASPNENLSSDRKILVKSRSCK